MGIFERIVRAIWNATKPTPDVDVDAVLSRLARGRDLDWRHSIVDLLKVLNLASDIGARHKLADELGYEGVFNGSAADNQWLHAQVMAKVRRGEFS